ncbi:unnamed protein product [Caenorhabditis auriculariae]|uniref:EF-hand domain-containing protein n=1 Tax=Caenorhabditis auriculariae TaxID=2777116 RepID=A0A8S1HJR3_9PELO|nr:unnamed protein product [Caenorhabditis auriculariae]
MDTDAQSSSDESLIQEQIRKLYRICDPQSNRIIQKEDLNKIADLVPRQVHELIAQKIGDSSVTEEEFTEILKSIVSPIDVEFSHSDKVVDDKPNLYEQVMKEPNLADELAELEKSPADDPLTQMLRDCLEEDHNFQKLAYTTNGEPFQSQSFLPNDINGLQTIRETAEVQINKPLYRPIQPEFGAKITSLADELCAAEKREEVEEEIQQFSTPDRIFKVVFVGDSAVGKTCFLHRFCHNRFKPLFNATIGVDFTVKTMRLSTNRSIAMQLWDTAGQERFRSITKQYFRKADGVILMFDVTSEQSFLNVRNWIDSVKAGVDERSVMCLVGNKVDLFGSDTARSSVYRAGEKLAKEFGMPFCETSAYTGYGIENCMKEMAERLQKREDDHLEEALRLEIDPPVKKRSWCCV